MLCEIRTYHLPDNERMSYVLRNTRGLEDYSTAKECKAKKVRKKIAPFCQSMDAFEYVDYVRQCIHPLTKNDATIVFSLQGGGG